MRNHKEDSADSNTLFITFFIIVCFALVALLALTENDLKQLKTDYAIEKALREEYELKYKQANGKLIEISQDPLWKFYNDNSTEFKDK